MLHNFAYDCLFLYYFTIIITSLLVLFPLPGRVNNSDMKGFNQRGIMFLLDISFECGRERERVRSNSERMIFVDVESYFFGSLLRKRVGINRSIMTCQFVRELRSHKRCFVKLK